MLFNPLSEISGPCTGINLPAFNDFGQRSSYTAFPTPLSLKFVGKTGSLRRLLVTWETFVLMVAMKFVWGDCSAMGVGVTETGLSMKSRAFGRGLSRKEVSGDDGAVVVDSRAGARFTSLLPRYLCTSNVNIT